MPMPELTIFELLALAEQGMTLTEAEQARVDAFRDEHGTDAGNTDNSGMSEG